MTKDYPSPNQLQSYEFEGVPIGFRLIWTTVNSLINSQGISNIADSTEPLLQTTQIDELSEDFSLKDTNNNEQSLCGGFLCHGGEFCVHNGHNICAFRLRLCINETLKCDGVANCAENDNSDEDYCKFCS